MTLDRMLRDAYRTPWGTVCWSDQDALAIEAFGPPPGVAWEPRQNVIGGPGTLFYRTYLRSFEWRSKAADARKRAGYVCERCGSKSELEVHHEHYRTLGNEQPKDLEVLCLPCHVKADEERKREAVAERERRRIDAYASAKYGEDWDSQGDADMITEQIQEKFDRDDY